MSSLSYFEDSRLESIAKASGRVEYDPITGYPKLTEQGLKSLISMAFTFGVQSTIALTSERDRLLKDQSNENTNSRN